MTDADRKVKRALIGIMESDPFFATLLLQQDIYADPTARTVVTNGKEIRYNPDFIDTMSRANVEVILVHEALHKAFGHSLRQRKMIEEMEKWLRETVGKNIDGLDLEAVQLFLHGQFNEAADMAINCHLFQRDGFPEDSGILPNGINPFNGKQRNYEYNKSVEHYFTEIMKDDMDDISQEPEEGSGYYDEGECESDGGMTDDTSSVGDSGGEQESEASEGEDENESKEERSGEQDETEEPKRGASKSGESVGQDPKPQNVFGEVEPAPSSDDKSTQDAEDEHIAEMEKAIQIAKAAGKCPVWIEKILEEFLAPPTKLPWQQVLRNLVMKKVKERLSFARPNRRLQEVDGLIMPTRISKTLGKIAFASDQSGSMNDLQVYMAYTCMDEIHAEFRNLKVDFVPFDTKVPFVHELTRWDFPMARHARKRYASGGTAIMPVIEAFNKLKPVVGMVLSDMEFYDWEEFQQSECQVPIIFLYTSPSMWSLYRNNSMEEYKEMLPYGTILAIDSMPTEEEQKHVMSLPREKKKEW